MKNLFVLCLVSCILFFIGCERSTAPISSSPVSLTLEYVGVTEAELRLQVDSSQPNDSYELLRDGQLTMSGTLCIAETSLVDSTLLPAHTYTYQAILIRSTTRSTQSAKLTLTTLDTTGHDFQWEIFTFESPFGSAALYDVAIINENNIWAVGMIYADSAQPWVPYNAVHWNGSEWEFIQIPYIYNGSPIVSPIRWVYAFNENDIWFGNSVHWDGKNFHNADVAISIFYGIGINKMWGISNGEFYVVGNHGTIAYSQDYGSSWQQLESGTDLPIQDIRGVVDWKTGKVNILAVACNLFSNDGNAVLQISENSVSQISTTNLPANISSLWSWKGREWYICGSGLYRTRTFDMPWKQVSGLPSVFQQKVRGNGPNDIFIVGHFGLVLHWNGSTWRRYSGMTGRYNGLAIQDDLVVATGTEMSGILAGSGIILIGRRN